ncbi:MAG TPA: hypothetical protein VNX25_01050 [Verrucomicrobiae bacterium]|nr:hypothetical protein [Verrucomicrobiae bacterium]
MRILRFMSVAAILAVASVGCATKGSVGSLNTKLDGMQKKLDELKVRIEKVESGKK